MSILGSKLTKSAGLGGAASAGAYSTSTYGMGSVMPVAGSSGPSAFASSVMGDIRQGKVTLAVVEAFVILLVLFYVWSRAVQGGG